ncbi:MAG: hypothetical protein ACRCVI_01605 [Mycoplasmoidaceae bacterium]
METRVKKYKSYRKQINKESTILWKKSKSSKELRKLENKLSNINKSLIEVEEVDLFSVDIVYDDEWQNYLKPLKEIISFYDLHEISKILSLSQEPTKEISIANKEDYGKLINSFIESDINYNELMKIREKIQIKNRNQENYKRDIKDLNNHIDEMLVECKKIRSEESFIPDIRNYNNKNPNSKKIKIIFIVSSFLFISLVLLAILFIILGGVNHAI